VLVRHFMTRDVVTVDAALTCEEALRVLRRHRIRRAPVVSGGVLQGIVTERDLTLALPWRIEHIDTERGRAAARRPVDEIMSRPVVTIGRNEHLDAAAELMTTRRIGALPVVECGVVVGIVTESDLFRVFVRMIQVGEGLRVTLQRPERATPSLEPLEGAHRLGLAVNGYFTHLAFGGLELIVMRVEGTRTGELAPLLVDAGWILVDQEGPQSAAQRASA
jgi:acetoin utilization protein AcuB